MLCRRSYIAVQVTLASTSAIYLLSDLIDAVLAAESGTSGGVTSPRAVKRLNLENDVSVVGNIFVGDALLVVGASQPGRRGRKILTGASASYDGGDVNGVDIGQLYVTPSQANMVLSVELITA